VAAPGKEERSTNDAVHGRRVPLDLAIYLLIVGSCLIALPACVFDSHELTAWVAGPKRQAIDTNTDHWQAYAFTDDAGTVTIKVPPEFRTFNRQLPSPDYDRYSGRILLDAQYDYRSKSIEDLNQFTIGASFARLPEAQNQTPPDPNAIERALLEVSFHSGSNEEGVKPTMEHIAGRYWMHFDRTASKFAEATSESFATLIDARTLLFVYATYFPAVRQNPSWLESRRALLLQVRDHVSVAP
jgi:hypothetical protein